MEKDKKLLVANLIWLSCCLAGCLVASISISWAQIPALVNIISVALSIASLILAVIAIFQSLLSNEGTHRALSDIGNAAKNILDISSKLSQDTLLFKDQFNEFGTVPTTLEALRSQIAEINAKSIDAPAAGGKSSVDSEKISNSEFSASAATSNATNGMIAALYMISKAQEKGIDFEPNDILDSNFAQYTSGVINTLNMTKFCDIEKNGKKYKVNSIAPFSSGQIAVKLDKVIEAKENPQFMLNIKNRIDKYFA